MLKISVFGVALNSVAAFTIPGLIPKTYRANDRIFVEFSKHLTNYGRHKVVANEHGEPHFLETKVEALGVPYMTMDDFPICSINGQKEKASALAGYFGESAVLETEIEVTIDTLKDVKDREAPYCHIACENEEWETHQV
jgi:hypothetical protein